MELNTAQYDSIFGVKAPRKYMKITIDGYYAGRYAKYLGIEDNKIKKTDFNEIKLLKKLIKKNDEIKYFDD
ncbi:MAG: hypothetical protein GQ534_03355 [Candidatus Delongbacteria bacterium]|nr:hypothetical protein [Candidatus Delongbacteria bacterium]